MPFTDICLLSQSRLLISLQNNGKDLAMAGVLIVSAGGAHGGMPYNYPSIKRILFVKDAVIQGFLFEYPFGKFQQPDETELQIIS